MKTGTARLRLAVIIAAAAVVWPTAEAQAQGGVRPPEPAVVTHGPGVLTDTVRVSGPRPRAVPAGPKVTLKITGTTLTGGQASGRDSVNVCNADHARLFCATAPFHHGVATFQVPAGPYSALGMFGDTAGGRLVAGRLVELPQFSVSGPVTVRMTERAATSRITMVTPRPAVTRETSIDFTRTSADGSSVEIALAVGVPLWVSPTTRAPAAGTMRFDVQQWLTAPSYLYDLTHQSVRVIPPQRFVVRSAGLATVDNRYYAAAASGGISLPDGWFPHEHFQANTAATFGVHVPGQEIIYFTGDPSVAWYNGYASGSGLQQDTGEIFHPGQRVTVDWGRYPLHPGVAVNLAGARSPVPVIPAASRAGDRLALYVFPFSDSVPGHIGVAFGGPTSGAKLTGRYQVDVNGIRVAGGSAAHWGGGPRVTVSPKPSVITFALDASLVGTRYPLSTSTRTVWSWRSSHEAGTTLPAGWACPFSNGGGLSRHCRAEPMITLGYQVAGLNSRGLAPSGRQVLDLTVGHPQLAHAAPVTHVTVQVSYDGGRTWHPATVTGRGDAYCAVYTAPGGGYVTLRTSATDAAGGSIAETITRAYRIAA